RLLRQRSTNTAVLTSHSSFSILTLLLFFFFFNTPPPTETYTLSLHDALPISSLPRPPWKTGSPFLEPHIPAGTISVSTVVRATGDRKSTRLNSSHVSISYAVFCLKKKKKI